MKTNNQLVVSVQDHSYAYCAATIKVRRKGSDQWQALKHVKENDQYVLDDFQPGDYELQVNGKKGWVNDHRVITLKPGLNCYHSSIAPAKTPYYLAADDEKVFFQKDETKILLFAYGTDAEKCTTEICKKNKIKIDHLAHTSSYEVQPTNEAQVLVSLPKDKKKAEAILNQLDDLIQTQLKEAGITAYITRPLMKGEQMVEGLTNELIVKFESHVTREEVERIAKRYGLEITRTVDYLGNTFVLRFGKYPSYDMMTSGLAMREELPIVWAEPNRIIPVDLDAFTPNDFLFPEQTYLNLINADDAWDTLDDIDVNLRAGSSNITIAVFDPHGVSPNHPDLVGNLTDGTAKIVANFDFRNWQNQTVAGLAGSHGTQSTTSATARFNNNTGTAGVAGNCHLIGGRLAATLLDQADAWIWAAGFQTGNTNPSFPAQLAQGADVISNSWGSNGAALSNTYRDAFDFVTTYGRNGRGCIMCFSIGNNGYLDFTTHPTRRRMYAAYEKTIAIGASISPNPTNPVPVSDHADHTGSTINLPALVDTRAYYSTYGPALDIVAPSHTANISVNPPLDLIVSGVNVGAGNWIGTNTTNTTLSAGASIGDSSITVTSSIGFVAGSFIAIGSPGLGNREFVQITSVVGNQLNISPNLTSNYVMGAGVVAGANDYSRRFGGTSHACPTVAGAAALILSVRPELNWVQVREILRTTAVQIDAAVADPIGQWIDTDGDGTADFSQWYGFGRLDLDAAVIRTRDISDLSDVVIRDNMDDLGTTPSAGWHAHSPDIWVTKDDDPIPMLAYNAAPPHENAVRGQDNYVFLRVKNRGSAASNEVYLRALICHFPGFEFRYPQEWQPTNRPGQAVPNPLTTGTYLIGEQRIDNLAVDAEQIVKITWDSDLVPPATVMEAGMAVNWHPCILAEVSPHDGPNPATSGHAVKDNNNLAHRNISIDDSTDGVDDDFAVAVVAGTSDKYGVQSIVIDRSDLPAGYEVIVRTRDMKIMSQWKTAINRGQILTAEPLPGGTSSYNPDETNKEPHGDCGIVLLESTRFAMKCCDGNAIIVHAPAKTRIETHCKSGNDKKPKVALGKYQNQEVLIFKGGADVIELPFNLASNEYLPVVIGMRRPSGMKKQGILKATQRKTNGELSPGYSIEG